jgi:transcriptional regulator with PAS, ATPase and Fis domain
MAHSSLMNRRLPIDLQAKLLRALQEKEIRPVGSTDRISISVRVIAATNRDLEEAVRQGKFRQDLFFRLNVVQIKLPPLRERKGDIPLLVNSFLEKFSDTEASARTISEDAMTRLMAYDWPGNVRELENAIERAVALGSSSLLHVGDLPSNLQQAGQTIADLNASGAQGARTLFASRAQSRGGFGGVARTLLRRDSEARNSIEASADGKDGGAGTACFRDRARIE